ncbi:MAG TPA: RNA-processing protein, partial [Candidatus Thermoplasmatota archaeon]|nr:RNA-processing protein [Candidatus Thermoplasmatota archaeon]
RRTIETSTGSDLSIDGDTVAILGEAPEVALAKEAVEMILTGAPHSAVYSFLERKRKDLRLRDLGMDL